MRVMRNFICRQSIRTFHFLLHLAIRIVLFVFDKYLEIHEWLSQDHRPNLSTLKSVDSNSDAIHQQIVKVYSVKYFKINKSKS